MRLGYSLSASLIAAQSCDSMNNIGMEFVDGTPDGPRRIFEANWSGECLMCSRFRIESVLKGSLFDVPGVYVLVGPSRADLVDNRVRFESELYVGQGDSVSERIQSHLRKKDFWRTAVVFHRPHNPLNAGNIKYLESRLVQFAKDAGNCVLNNSVVPQLPTLSKTEKSDTEQFLTRTLFVLKALGFDFFHKELFPVDESEPADLAVPEKLRPFIEDVRAAVAKLPDAQFYSTKTPDFRAKVVDGKDFRVFARIKLRKDGFKFDLKDVAVLKLLSQARLEGYIRDRFFEAHLKAQEYLLAKGGSRSRRKPRRVVRFP
jgi:hypothetical protein